MSIIPVYSAILVGLLVVSLFFWKMWLLGFVAIMLVLFLVAYLYDVANVVLHYEAGFWLFIFSEAIIFGALIICCLYFDLWWYESLSSPLEIPFLGCFVLLGSSVTITGFHHVMSWRWSWVLLLFTVFLGLAFVALQIVELGEAAMNGNDGSFYISSFCTVGLHFIHVLLGVLGLITVLAAGVDAFGVYRCSVITWYWHFVDYIWLFVYTFVYVC
uniref:cytochrome c oxidase subunit III n=1 Tax=Mosgovoyia sp. SQ20 TaxID=2854040 RepID=UPI001F144F64|nr:cytochrome c oxidase subunit III [Mosgovoyia sp. SQ20]UKS07998.1 cytochrome c oxidase subunit III [Mosgovoyia sp. SQ20]